MSDYIADHEIVKLRITNGGLPTLWSLDGIDCKGGYSEACYDLESFDEAVKAIPDFCRWNAPHLIPDDLLVEKLKDLARL